MTDKNRNLCAELISLGSILLLTTGLWALLALRCDPLLAPSLPGWLQALVR